MNKIKALALVLALSVGLTAMPQKANALVILELAADNTPIFYNPDMTLLCIFVLPFCLLDQKTDITHVNVQDLLDNGFTQFQISNIQAGQNEVGEYMKNHQMTSSSEMPQAIDAIKATLNDDYLGFVGVAR